MECLKTFINSIQQFFTHLDKHANVSEELLKKSVKPCKSIENQCLILRSVLPEDSLEGTGLEHLPKLRILLINCVLDAVNKECNILINIRDEIAALDLDLLEKYKEVEQLFKQLQKKNLVHTAILNPASPRFEHIVDWCLDTWRYYHSLNLQISVALENPQFQDQKSVQNLIEAFKEDYNLKKELNKIRGFELQSFPFLQ